MFGVGCGFGGLWATSSARSVLKVQGSSKGMNQDIAVWQRIARLL